jgi:asparagine synthase (glutamine-hydrolysing)
MCGIAAIVKHERTRCAASVVHAMRDEVSHRGPDGFGSQFFKACQQLSARLPEADCGWTVGLGHRRLAILDLSVAGDQPMAYRGRYWISYNGEVYNFVELRAELERCGHEFRSTSDTEVILAAYAEWGVHCFSRFRGMWGMAIFDRDHQRVIVSRDHLGIKPLYLWKGDGVVAIVSEIKQLRHVPGFVPRLDAAVASEFIKTGYEDSERTFFRGVEPLKAGSWASIPLDTLIPSSPQDYWHPETIVPSVTDPAEAGKLLADQLRTCVGIQLRSDVPVGCSLSGGLDSSAIAVIAHGLKNGSGQALETFTLTCPGDAIDERAYAEAVVEQVRARSHFVTLDPNVFLSDLDRFVWTHDEPVGNLSMYAAYNVARLTRESGIKVTLNGQGGDEVLSGYWQSYFLHLRELWRLRQFGTLTDHLWGARFGEGNPDLLGQIPVMLRRYMARRKPPLAIEFGEYDASDSGASGVLKHVLSLDGQRRRLFEMRKLFLPRLLKWDDRNFMAFSVESRYPFLDHQLIELCLSFSPRALYRRGWTKFPLRVGLTRQLPPLVRDRRTKIGFETPQDRWLCGPLRPTVERWLNSDRPIWDYVDRRAVQELAEQTWRVAGKRDELGQTLFRVYIFDRWLDVCQVNAA